jgi:hypothetical protein
MTSVLIACIVGLAGPTAKVSVDGEGYLRFVRDGRVVYARSATLSIADGKLSQEAGCPVAPTISVSGSPAKIEVDLEGNVRGAYGGQTRLLGRLVLAVFAGAGPTPDTSGLMVASDRPTLANPGEGATGVIRSSGSSAEVTPVKPKATPITPEKPPAWALATGPVHITVHPLSQVSGKQFLLGEIADVEGDGADALRQVVIGESPALGVERGIDKVRIQGRLRMAGINPTSFDIQVPANAKVGRQSQKVTNDQFSQKAIEAALVQVPGADFKCTSNQGDMAVPEGTVELIAERTTQNGTNVAVTIAIMVDGKRFNSRTLTLVAAIGANQVKAGSAVRIKVISNGAAVEVSGRTKTTANVGGSVEVITNPTAQMPSSTLTGVLKAPGIVEVKL